TIYSVHTLHVWSDGRLILDPAAISSRADVGHDDRRLDLAVDAAGGSSLVGKTGPRRHRNDLRAVARVRDSVLFSDRHAAHPSRRDRGLGAIAEIAEPAHAT